MTTLDKPRQLLKLMPALVLLFASPALGETVAGTPRVVDGDTLEIGSTTIRLHGIDAPEVSQLGGREAIVVLAELVNNKTIQCEGNEEDDYKRLIAKCYAGDEDINAAMVRRGWAWAFVRYSSDYLALEQRARQAKHGIWKGSPQAPWDYRAERWKVAQQVAPKGCPIKGNITRNGERIYHPPWSPWYRRTSIDERKGERWFCSEREALEAGWRPPYWR